MSMETTWKVIFGLLIVLVMLYFSYSFGINNQSITETNEKALLDVQIYQWAQNENNLDEMFFDYWLYNYGNTEARNVKIKCDLFEEDLVTKRTSVSHNYGNIASRSGNLGEVITMQPIIEEGELFVAQCHVESCDNCEILYKRIPALIETYEG